MDAIVHDRLDRGYPQRLAAAKRVDKHRVLVTGVTTDVTSQFPGQIAYESLTEALNSAFSFLELETISCVGCPVVREIYGNWDRLISPFPAQFPCSISLSPVIKGLSSRKVLPGSSRPRPAPCCRTR